MFTILFRWYNAVVIGNNVYLYKCNEPEIKGDVLENLKKHSSAHEETTDSRDAETFLRIHEVSTREFIKGCVKAVIGLAGFGYIMYAIGHVAGYNDANGNK